MPRFRYDNLAACAAGDTIELDRSEASHLFKILRARTGDTVGLLDGKGTLGNAMVTADKRLTIQNVRKVERPARKLHLYLAPPRRQKLHAEGARLTSQDFIWDLLNALFRSPLERCADPGS